MSQDPQDEVTYRYQQEFDSSYYGIVYIAIKLSISTFVTSAPRLNQARVATSMGAAVRKGISPLYMTSYLLGLLITPQLRITID
jgi:hypothetical protein